MTRSARASYADLAGRVVTVIACACLIDAARAADPTGPTDLTGPTGLVMPDTRKGEHVDPADRSATSSLVGRRLALVVGVGSYDQATAWPRLANTNGDATALGNELATRYGFRVTSLADPTLLAFKRALRAIAEEAGPADDVLVFVGAHGYFDDDDRAGYLVMKDATASCGAGCYPLDNVKRALYETRARHVLVMLDACYAGTFEIRTALDGGVLRQGPLDAPLLQSMREYARYPSRLLLASVGKAPVSDGAPGMHSPFMAALLDELASPGPSGVVSLDRLYVALAEGHALPVARPSLFAANVPAHPSGTFLFIEDVRTCDAFEAFLAGGASAFVTLRRGDGGDARAWADVTPATWTLPGARRCDVWDWHDGQAAEVRCDLGPWDRALAEVKAREMFVALKECVAEEPSEPSETTRSADDNELQDLVLSLPARGRKLTVSRLCAERSCTLSVIVE